MMNGFFILQIDFNPRRDLNPGTRPKSKSQSDDLDRSAIGPAEVTDYVIGLTQNVSLPKD